MLAAAESLRCPLFTIACIILLGPPWTHPANRKIESYEHVDAHILATRGLHLNGSSDQCGDPRRHLFVHKARSMLLYRLHSEVS